MLNFISINPQVVKYNNDTFFGFNDIDNDIKRCYFFNKRYAFIETNDNKFYFLYPETFLLNGNNVKISYDQNILNIIMYETKNNIEIMNISRISYYDKKYVFSEGSKEMLYTNYNEFFLELYKYLLLVSYEKNNVIDEMKYHIEYAKISNTIDELRIKFIFSTNKNLILENYGKHKLLDKLISDRYYTFINSYINFSITDTCHLCNNEKKLLLLGCLNKHYVCNECFWKLNNKCPFCRYKFSNNYAYYTD